MIRQPIVVLVGHIDHGKSSILERLKEIVVTKQEAGGITQTIRSYNLPIDIIQKKCKDLLKGQHFSVPGLVILDTPGHAAFNNMRKRGGNLADIAILVIDINEGVMPQTVESIEVLKAYKTPFIVALNKIDNISGWYSQPDRHLNTNLDNQNERVKSVFDTKFYEIVGKIYERGFVADRYDRIEDFTQHVAIVPCSAKTGEGIPELLMVLVGLAQKFLEQSLETSADKPGQGTILEVKDEKGIGTTLDVVIYDGQIKRGDQIVIGGLSEPITTKVRGLFEAERGKMKPIESANAAAGVRIVAPDVKGVVSGMPLLVANSNLEEAKERVQAEVDEVVIETDNDGVVVKADSLGSLEALIGLLKEKDICIKKASVGEITKKDLADASAEEEPLNKVILAFNVSPVETKDVKIISNNVIYKIIEDYVAWQEEEKKKQEEKHLENLIRPAKMEIIKGCIFRQSNPCVVGVRILEGTLKPDVELMKANGNKAGYVKSMQVENESVKSAERGKEVAISIPGIIGGRQVLEMDILYVDIPESHFRDLKKFKKLLKPAEIELLKEIAEIKRKENPLWGV
ncbi:MAG: translation initiation factor IF-2 [Candidatus Woesearchaeota archaeon]